MQRQGVSWPTKAPQNTFQGWPDWKCNLTGDQLFIRLKSRVGNKGLPKICASSHVTQADCFSSSMDAEMEWKEAISCPGDPWKLLPYS